MTDNIEMVQTFLRLVEARDLPAAGRYLAPGATITFPGGRTFAGLEEQVRSSAGRFRSVRKSFERFDHLDGGADVDGNGGSVVYVFGTLSGTALDGTPFDGVRFIDRFAIEDGLIVDQKVWNDLAESGVLAVTATPGEPEPS